MTNDNQDLIIAQTDMGSVGIRYMREVIDRDLYEVYLKYSPGYLSELNGNKLWRYEDHRYLRTCEDNDIDVIYALKEAFSCLRVNAISTKWNSKLGIINSDIHELLKRKEYHILKFAMELADSTELTNSENTNVPFLNSNINWGQVTGVTACCLSFLCCCGFLAYILSKLPFFGNF